MLLNYTTKVPVEKTIHEIEGLLRQHRVTGIQMRYGSDGEVVSLTFSLPTSLGEQTYELPVNVQGVAKTLEGEKAAGELPALPWRVVESEKELRAHASRVAWRVVKDWLEAQLAIVQSRCVAFEQVMLPYQLVGDGHETVYQLYQRQIALPAPKEG